MINKDYIYNNEYLVLFSKNCSSYFHSLSYTFGYCMEIDNEKSVKEQVDIIKKSNYKTIIFVDYEYIYDSIMQSLSDKEYKFIFTKSLGTFSKEENYFKFNKIYEFYKKGKINEIAFLDYNLFLIFKDKLNCKHILLDIERCKKDTVFDEKKVGILNECDNEFHSYYNELSALKFDNYTANINRDNKTVKKFLNLFNIKHEKNVNNYNDNLVNLYINFSDSSNLVFLKSMDLSIPCIIGNNDFLNDELSKYLFVKEDDSVDEIRDKIRLVKKNRDEILQLYEKFRCEYSKKSKDSIFNFIGIKDDLNNYEYEKLITVVVPVYNTEKYLDNCLKSVIKATNNLDVKYEILIINDGSKDNSEVVINKYKNKYPKIIRYIKQENKGLGNVRNVALREAKGKYIASIDSDDEIDEKFFTSCLKYLKDDVDVVIFNWLSKMKNGNFETSAIEFVFNDYNKYEGLLYSSIMPSTCNKIIKRSLYDDLQITFLEDKYEDFSTNPFILLKANKIKYINKPYYHYYITEGSIMRSSANLSMINAVLEVAKRIKKYEYLFKVDKEKFIFYTLSWRIEEFIINQIYDLDSIKRCDYINYMYDKIYSVLKEMFSNKYYIEMIEKLSTDKKEYILNRNSAIICKKLDEFIKDNKEKYYKLSAQTIYFNRD